MSTYLRTPAIHENKIAFITEDDLWTVPREGGLARRLTTLPGMVSYPAFSADSSLIAFTSNHEGIDQVYVMPSQGGELRRLTFEGQPCQVIGFTPDGKKVLFRSSAKGHWRRQMHIYTVDLEGKKTEPLPVGEAVYVSFDATGKRVAIGRNWLDPAIWKRYRGGTAGDIWTGDLRNLDFRRLLKLEGNMTNPLWAGDRIFFISDHEGIGRIYSCYENGGDLKRHTVNEDFYVRFPQMHKNMLVYQMGAEIYTLDIKTNKSQKVDIETGGVRRDTYKKFVDTHAYLEEMVLHPKGHTAAYTIRGKLFVMSHWVGAPVQLGKPEGVRYRLPCWVFEGESLAVVSDESGEETLEIWDVKTREKKTEIAIPEIHRITEMKESSNDLLAIADIAMNLYLLDLKTKETRFLAAGSNGRIRELSWSPDNRYLALVKPGSVPLINGGIVCLCDVQSGEITELTTTELSGHSPTFDPEGKYLYLLSERTFNPVPDKIQFGANCAQATKPYLFALDKTQKSPFEPTIEEKADQKEEEAKKEKKTPTCQVDLDGLHDRLVEFPAVPLSNYSDLAAIEGKVFFLQHPLLGLLDTPWEKDIADELKPALVSFDLEKKELSTFASNVDFYALAGGKLAYFHKKDLRIVDANEKNPSEENERQGYNVYSGYVDLTRMRVATHPVHEWKQMFLEAWRLQRDHFWTTDMGGVPWEKIKDKYLPLVDKVSTRSELSDLIWELQGELGTSHAYEFGGEYPQTHKYDVGLLGADLELLDNHYFFKKIHRGDPWKEGEHSPLIESGVRVKEGECLLSINGTPVGPEVSPHSLLVNQAGNHVTLCIASPDKKEKRDVVVKTLHSERMVRYRDWVEQNRRITAEKSDGLAGYIHIPDMGGVGLSEFFRSFRAQVEKPALIIDVRSNGGGFVSQMIIEQLRRKIIGYDRPRYGKRVPYPTVAVKGPMVAISDEHCGSDGDIFCRAFQDYKLGPVVGKRTWGGVIGIDINGYLVDGSIVTQPEFAFWFYSSGWNVENRGVEPDIEVEFDPKSYVTGKDPQLDKAIAVALELLANDPICEPEI